MKEIYFKLLSIFVLLVFAQQIQAQTLTTVAPSIGMEGTTINVAISGQNSNFQQGTTTVWFNQGSSTIYASNVNVSNNTSLVAQVGIPYGTPLGLYQSNVQDPFNTIALANSFTVLANPNAPIITNVNPSTTMEGTALTVAISGQNTNFQQGTTTVWFNQGSSTIYASNVSVNSQTSLDAFFNIPFGTPLGLYDTNVQDPIDNTVTSPNSFTITANPNAPNLVSVTPNNGDLGTTIPVAISGQNTNFLQGTGTLIFVQGSSSLITSNLLFNSNTDLGATLTIPSNANPGYYDVYFSNPIDGIMLLASGFYVNPPPCGSISVTIDQQPCPNGYAFITMSGGYLPYTLEIDGQSILVNDNYYNYLPPATGDFIINSLTDNFGCPATAIDSIIQNDEFIGSLAASDGCVGSPLTLTPSVTYSSAVSYTSYYGGDGGFSSTTSYVYNFPGTYTPSMQVFTANGCAVIVSANSPVQIFASPQDSIISMSNANCGQTNGSFEIIGIGNGPFDYNISGIGGYTSTTSLNNNLAAGLYNLSVIDTNGCSANSALSIANISNLTNITGHIQTATFDSASATTVKLLMTNDTIGAMDVAYSTVTDLNGNYSFSNLTEGSYILVAEPDTIQFPDAMITYYNGEALWFNADTIQINCFSQEVINLTLLNTSAQIGTAYVGGFVSDYFFNMLSNTDLVLYDNNTNQSVARTSTDAWGNYSFYNVNNGQYSVFVDIPGLSHNTFYTFGVASSSTLWNKSFFVDYNYRTIDTVLFLVGLNKITSFEANVYPNPFGEQTTIKYNLPETSKVTIELYNYLGEKLEILVDEVKTSGNYQTTLTANNRAKGIYFLRITAGHRQKTIKIISAD